jgi:transcriptional regulator with XRE-family HTH domain
VNGNERMRDLGATVRRVREFVGLSQERLAKLAGVSQGAVSRLEAGRASATPFLVVAKIHGALDRALAGVDPVLVSDDLRLQFEPARFWSGGDGERKPVTEVAASTDRVLETLIVRYRHLPPTTRATFLAIVESVLSALE